MDDAGYERALRIVLDILEFQDRPDDLRLVAKLLDGLSGRRIRLALVDNPVEKPESDNS